MNRALTPESRVVETAGKRGSSGLSTFQVADVVSRDRVKLGPGGLSFEERDDVFSAGAGHVVRNLI